jgi:4-amino-4-deoxy-L-arabinose transferase-like glycosyltransferase
MDMLLTACLTLAMAFFLVAMNDQTPRRRLWLYGFYAAIGLGILAKGPVAILLPCTSIARSIFFAKVGRLANLGAEVVVGDRSRRGALVLLLCAIQRPAIH